jgi:hypothetical protein
MPQVFNRYEQQENRSDHNLARPKQQTNKLLRGEQGIKKRKQRYFNTEPVFALYTTFILKGLCYGD